MSNYYDTCLANIHELIQNNKKSEALEILEEELSMPYIPKLYRDSFEELYRSLNLPDESQSAFFTNMDDISQNLLGNSAQVAKALLSLENLNLRPYIDELIDLLRSNALSDEIKRMILLIAMEQELSFDCFVVLDQKPYSFNISDLSDPFQDLHYLNIYKKLHELYESNDPSFLKLTLDVLNMEIIRVFPFVNDSLTVEAVVLKTKSYLNKG